jgi:hypothetical protein
VYRDCEVDPAFGPEEHEMVTVDAAKWVGGTKINKPPRPPQVGRTMIRPSFLLSRTVNPAWLARLPGG